jgi:hypothetical protein
MLRDLSNVEIVALEALEALGGAGSTGEIRAMLRREYRRGLFSTIRLLEHNGLLRQYARSNYVLTADGRDIARRGGALQMAS